MNNQLTSESMNLEISEQEYLQKITNKKFKEVIFDTDKDQWEDQRSIYNRMWLKDLLLFIVEDTENNKFGYYYDEDLRFYYVNSKLFTLKRNGVEKFYVYEDIFTYGNYTETIPKIEIKQLICLGAGDQIVIGIESEKEKSYCQHNEHFVKYKGEKDVFIGRSGKDKPFTPKRITVIRLMK